MNSKLYEPIRIAFIDYLNALPLGWSMLQGEYPGAFELLHSSPSQCAEMIRAGEADIGLIPAIEFQRIEGLRVLPDIAIASKKEALSVLLVSRRPIDRIRSIALDESSRTSVALLAILLRRHFPTGRRAATGRQPAYNYKKVTTAPDLAAMLERCDAALLIGDPALRVDRARFHVWDLAGEWRKLTGLPFVFAFWAVRAGADLGPAAGFFYEAKRLGLERLADIAAARADSSGLPAPVICDYLQNYLNYDLDADNLKGLDLFYRFALEDGLIDQKKELSFYPWPASRT